MLSLERNPSFSSSMVNTPVISPTTLKDDPFRAMMVGLMRTPDVIDFSLSFTTSTTTSSSGSRSFNDSPSATTSQSDIAHSHSTTTHSGHTPVPSYYEPLQSSLSQNYLTVPEPTYTSLTSESEIDHANLLLDLSPRIRNQSALNRPPAFPRNVAPVPVIYSSSHSRQAQTISQSNPSSSAYTIFEPQSSDSSLPQSLDFAYPYAVDRRPVVHRNVTSTVSRPTDSLTQSYESGISHCEDILSSDSNTLEYFSESNDRNIFQAYNQESTSSPSPQPIAGPSTLDDLNERRHEPHDRYLSARSRNNRASKKFRSSKRDQQKEMERQIAFYKEDNQKCHKMIAQLEKEIEQCKAILFRNFKKN